MAAFNTLLTVLTCPHCGHRGDMEVEFRFGRRDQLRYRLGDRLVWTGGGGAKPLRRPADGNLTGDGYVDCPHCRKDFWVTLRVRADVIAEVAVDHTRSGYIR